MSFLLPLLISCGALAAVHALRAVESTSPRIKAHYTRLPFDDHGATGKYADIIVDLPQRGLVIFSREFGYQPRWLPLGGKPYSVARLIARRGDGPDERPDNHNIACHAAIVAQTHAGVTVHWRYAPDINKPSFTDFRAAYNEAGNAAPFYAEYADEYFTIHADGKVVRTVKNGCYRLDDWNDPGNQIEQTLQLTPDGIRETALRPAQRSKVAEHLVTGPPRKSGRTENLVCYWRFDEGAGFATTETQSGKACDIGGVEAYWRPGVSGTCLSFDSYSSAVTLPAAQCPNLKGEFTVSAWIAIQEYPFNLAAIVDHLDGNKGGLLGVNARGQVEFRIGDGDAVQSVITERVPLYEWVHVAAVAKSGTAAVVYLNGKPVATSTKVAAFVDATNTALSIGMTRSLRQFPRFAERAVTKQFQTAMVFSGLIDEVQLFDQALSESEVRAEHAALKPPAERPLKPWVLPAGPAVSPGFRAEYTKLKYSPEWDGLWRVGDCADIVVTFAAKPWRYVFWRGTRYLPSLVTAPGPRGIWSNDQGAERYGGQERGCYEHMSDMLCHPGQATEDVLNDAGVITANTDGETMTIYRSDEPSIKRVGNWNLQLVNLKGATKQFQIGEIGAWSQTLLHKEVYWRGWSHYPVQLVPSDGTRVNSYDRPSSACPATFHELRHPNGNNIEAMVMYGLTDKQPGELTALNRSWNFAPAVTETKGCVSLGYERRERAFKFTKTGEAVAFTVQATREQPLENPAFIIAHWDGPESNAALKINGQAKVRGVDYRSGIEINTDGAYTLVIWMPWSATETVSFAVAKKE